MWSECGLSWGKVGRGCGAAVPLLCGTGDGVGANEKGNWLIQRGISANRICRYYCKEKPKVSWE